MENRIRNRTQLLTLTEMRAMDKKWKRRHARKYIRALEKFYDDRIRALDPSQWGFYGSEVWRDLRYRVLKAKGRICALCGVSSGPMHVDHIKPRSKYPKLALEFDNLQVLCAACNLGKSNSDETNHGDQMQEVWIHRSGKEDQQGGRQTGRRPMAGHAEAFPNGARAHGV